MSCNNCHPELDCNECSCLTTPSTDCVFYRGATLPCLNIVKGDVLTAILTKVDTAICNGLPSFNNTSSVTSCNSNIVVTPTTIGANTNYLVCLASSIPTNIATNTSNIATLNACINNTVKNIVSNTATVTVDSSNSCGRTLRIEIPTPSPLVAYNGIIHNNTTVSNTTNSAITQTLKSFNHNYSANNNLQNEDEIRFVATGQTCGDTTTCDGVIIELFDTTSSTILSSFTKRDLTIDTKTSWLAEGTISVINVAGGLGLFDLKFFCTKASNGFRGLNLQSSTILVSADVTNINYSSLAIRVRYIHTTGAFTSTYNFARKLTVEVLKKI